MIYSLKNFENDEKKRQTQVVLSELTAWSDWKNAQKVALYMATPMEFDLSELFVSADRSGKQILIPKCLPQRQMIFCPYDKERLVRSNFGLLEPDSMEAVEPDLILVPGLAWNAEGYRVGFGGGYYDRYLADFSGLTVSVAYDFQVADFEPEGHDIAVKRLFLGRKKEN